MQGEEAVERTVLRVIGSDRVKFLQGLITNDIKRTADGLVYAAILTPQGKYLFDFFLAEHGDSLLLDCAEVQADALVQRLTLYKLRADVRIERSDLHVQRGLGAPSEDAFADPRSSALGWRRYSAQPGLPPSTDWDSIRVAHAIPETDVELIPNETFILEVGFERLNGVDFRKGCYVGQEVTARMKHKTELRKGLAIVSVEGCASVGAEILSEGKSAGTLFTQSNGRALAYLRFDRAGPAMTAGTAQVGFPVS